MTQIVVVTQQWMYLCFIVVPVMKYTLALASICVKCVTRSSNTSVFQVATKNLVTPD